jgi:hypothetical protein
MSRKKITTCDGPKCSVQIDMLDVFSLPYHELLMGFDYPEHRKKYDFCSLRCLRKWLKRKRRKR